MGIGKTVVFSSGEEIARIPKMPACVWIPARRKRRC